MRIAHAHEPALGLSHDGAVKVDTRVVARANTRETPVAVGAVVSIVAVGAARRVGGSALSCCRVASKAHLARAGVAVANDAVATADPGAHAGGALVIDGVGVAILAGGVVRQEVNTTEAHAAGTHEGVVARSARRRTVGRRVGAERTDCTRYFRLWGVGCSNSRNNADANAGLTHALGCFNHVVVAQGAIRGRRPGVALAVEASWVRVAVTDGFTDHRAARCSPGAGPGLAGVRYGARVAIVAAGTVTMVVVDTLALDAASVAEPGVAGALSTGHRGGQCAPRVLLEPGK